MADKAPSSWDRQLVRASLVMVACDVRGISALGVQALPNPLTCDGITKRQADGVEADGKFVGTQHDPQRGRAHGRRKFPPS
jgi:hypothetical protein